jgi:hypothetical protein
MPRTWDDPAIRDDEGTSGDAVDRSGIGYGQSSGDESRSGEDLRYGSDVGSLPPLVRRYGRRRGGYVHH